VREETPGLSQHARDQHAPGDPLEAVGEFGARQIEQVDELEQQEDACMCVARSEEPLLPIGEARATGEKGQ
jgi:hypothetical protein